MYAIRSYYGFDLGTILGREAHGFDPHGGFFDAINQDPVLRRVKLIGEPWDIGPGGYQVGGFPPGWAEWNDKYRDTVRDFWRGEPGVLGDFASRIAGSGDVYDLRGRRAWSSVNFLTAHDGFTLNDLVSYNENVITSYSIHYTKLYEPSCAVRKLTLDHARRPRRS